MGVNNLSHSKTDENWVSQFVYMASRIAELASGSGIRIVPFYDSSLPHLGQKSPEERTKIIADLKVYLQICEASLEGGGSLSDSVSVSWAAIKQLGLRPTNDLFSYIRPDNVIEIHDSMGIQIFRNFNFFHFCSYSLEQLFSYPWNHLYTRNDVVLHRLMGIAMDIYEGRTTTTVATGLEAHQIDELYSPCHYKIEAEVKYISPLFDRTGRPIATVAVETGRLIGGLNVHEGEAEEMRSWLHLQPDPTDLI